MGSDGRRVFLRVFSAFFVAVLVVFAATASGAAEFATGKSIEMRADYTDSFTRIAPPAAYYDRMAGLRSDANAGAPFTVHYNGFSAQAQTAFQHAVNIWSSLLGSNVPIEVTANWTPLGAGVLGSAGPAILIRDWTTGTPPPVPGAWYHIAVANAISGSDLVTPANDPFGNNGVEIIANFNSTFPAWYFGTDGNTPGGQWDFVTVVLHELCHGLGFSGFADPFTPTMLNGGFPSVYSTFTQNGAGTYLTSLAGASLSNALLGDAWFAGPATVAANGGSRPRLYAPNPWEGGSSFSHFDENSFPPGVDGSMMTPFLSSAEAAHSPGQLVLGVFNDVGWVAADPIEVDLTGNGSDGPLDINKGDTLTLNATIINASGQQGDYFLVALYKGMFWTYKFNSKSWVPGQSATYQGPLANLAGKKIFMSNKLPPGKIIFYFAVDTNRNNKVDLGSLAWDKLIARIN